MIAFPQPDHSDSHHYYERGYWRDSTIVDDLRNLAATRGDDVVISTYSGDGEIERVTFGRLWDAVNHLAMSMLELGIGRGDVVSFQLPNCWQLTAMYIACARVGAVAHPMPMIHREHEIEWALRAVESRLVVTATQFTGYEYARVHREIARSLDPEPYVAAMGEGLPAGVLSFQSMCTGDEVAATELATLDSMGSHADDACIVKFTSGTTGEPKGVVHTHNTLYAATQNAVVGIGLPGDSVMISPSPMAHMTGLLCGVLMPMTGRVAAVLMDRWEPNEFARVVQAERGTVTWGVPSYWFDLLQVLGGDCSAVKSLRIVVCSGAPIPRSLARRVEAELGAEFRPDWGMTETAGVTFVGNNDTGETRLSTDGRPAGGMEVKVVNREGVEQPYGTEGRLLVRGPSRFSGYLNRPDLTEAVKDQDGWLDSGDLATIDAQGRVTIVGRGKDVIIRGGENIPVVEIEDALLGMDGIADVAVVAAVDERLGERAVAVVVPAGDGAGPIDLGRLQARLATLGIAKHYWPEAVKVISEMPRTASGKVQKYKLREQVASEGVEWRG